MCNCNGQCDVSFHALQFPTDLTIILCSQCECIDPDNQGKPTAQTCGLPQYKGDSNCDDENNNKGCEFDGGDCCPKTVDGGEVSKNYCSKVGRDSQGCPVVCAFVIPACRGVLLK